MYEPHVYSLLSKLNMLNFIKSEQMDNLMSVLLLSYPVAYFWQNVRWTKFNQFKLKFFQDFALENCTLFVHVS